MDNRAIVKIEFTIFGQTFRMDSSINWSRDEETGVDPSVEAFFVQSYDAAVEVFNERIAEQEDKAREKAERAQLARLQAKYGT